MLEQFANHQRRSRTYVNIFSQDIHKSCIITATVQLVHICVNNQNLNVGTICKSSTKDGRLMTIMAHIEKVLNLCQHPLSGHSLGSRQSLERRSSCSKSWSAS